MPRGPSDRGDHGANVATIVVFSNISIHFILATMFITITHYYVYYWSL